MGRVANNRRHRKGGNADNKQYKKQARTRNRRRDIGKVSIIHYPYLYATGATSFSLLPNYVLKLTNYVSQQIKFKMI